MAFYTILTYLVAAKTVNHVVDGVEEYNGVTLISSKNEEIQVMLTKKMGRACTVFQGKEGYSQHGNEREDMVIVFTVMTRLELAKLSTEIDKMLLGSWVLSRTLGAG